MRRITVNERRARLAVRHHLAPTAKGAGVTEVARNLVGLHATDPASVYLSAYARLENGDVATVEHALAAVRRRPRRSRPSGPTSPGRCPSAKARSGPGGSGWLGDDIAELDTAAVQVELARAWLRSFGPATAADLKWWTGWTVAWGRSSVASRAEPENDP
ncbi:MAG: DNA glycosylase AlkZ-like family protein [Acidimicrobiia bacterium]